MERAEIAELFYDALINSNKVEQLAQFLSARVQWTLSAADPHMGGETSPPTALKFAGKGGCGQLALYFRDGLKVFSGDLTGCVKHKQLVFVFGTVRLQCDGPAKFAETKIAAKLTFRGSKILKAQIGISWPLVFEA
jgi:hypothetical protein